MTNVPDTNTMIVTKLIVEDNSGILIEESRILLRTAKSDNIRKWNKCGSLTIYDHRTLILNLHMRLMKQIHPYLRNTINTDVKWDFLFGILEGDGCVVGGKGKFGIGFSCHKDDTTIRQLLDILQVKYSVDSSRVKRKEGSGIYACFWLFEILLNLKILSDNLFIFYPKRRKMFIERLFEQSTVKFIVGEKDNLAPVSEQFFIENDVNLTEIEQILNSLFFELKKLNQTNKQKTN